MADRYHKFHRFHRYLMTLAAIVAVLTALAMLTAETNRVYTADRLAMMTHDPRADVETVWAKILTAGTIDVVGLEKRSVRKIYSYRRRNHLRHATVLTITETDEPRECLGGLR